MMTPTERSMPAVRMTSVWAMPSDGDDGHLLQDQRQVERREELAADDEAEEDDAEDEDEERDRRRIGVQEVLRRAGAGSAALPRRPRRSAVAGRQDLLEVGRRSARLVVSLLIARSRLPRRMTGQESNRCRLLSRRQLSSLAYFRREGKSAPAELQAFLDRDRRNAVDRLGGDQRRAGVEEARPSGRSPAACPTAIASSAIDAILCGYCCEVAPMTPASTFLTPGQPPSIETISTLPSSLPARLQGFPRAGRGRLVDRVDDVDVGALLQRVLHRRAALVLVALADLVVADARVVLVAVVVRDPSRRCRSPA